MVGAHGLEVRELQLRVVNRAPLQADRVADIVLVNGAGPIVISGPGVAPDDGFSGYAPFATRGAARWGDYSAAASDEAGNIWMGAEMIPHIPPVPGILAANWGTFITAVAP